MKIGLFNQKIRITMTNIQKLETAIRSALPELMELSEGCEVQFNKQTYDCKSKIIEIDETNEACILYLQDKFTNHSLDFVKRKSVILGVPITLLHLLRWLDTTSYYCELKTNGMLDIEKGMFSNKDYQLDLSKPLLRDQSEDVINELVKLLK